MLLAVPTVFADEVVAYRNDTPILRSQLAGDIPEVDKLVQLTLSPAIYEYLSAHRNQWEPDEATLQRAEAAMRRSLACLPYPTTLYDTPSVARFTAKALISGVLMQRFIHRSFGGGRLLEPKRGVLLPGVMAFDANNRMVHQLEEDGAFRILDPALRSEVFATLGDTEQGTLVPESQAEALFDPNKVFITCEPEAAAKVG
ncbi:hypothetical protein ABB26_11805 [Stenotrophomonas humi]|uniref:Uncharacterized protein n=1 Tax=Stenotrophomonas humi TaxID=405444 RepID=A0A0R0CDZ7_9GAMM|nr:hypothetical protein ABB26_11805 [Stenotrophomonas humi]